MNIKNARETTTVTVNSTAPLGKPDTRWLSLQMVKIIKLLLVNPDDYYSTNDITKALFPGEVNRRNQMSAWRSITRLRKKNLIVVENGIDRWEYRGEDEREMPVPCLVVRVAPGVTLRKGTRPARPHRKTRPS